MILTQALFCAASPGMEPEAASAERHFQIQYGYLQ